uniref:flagellar protein FliT n=1 Tax=Halomonas sp. TaxID=1486246 RepID=UPI002619E041|nr:flagellar protein FliT [Halomonas sp.]
MPLVNRYEMLLEMTCRMLELSRNASWEELIALETDYMEKTASLPAVNPGQLDQTSQKRLRELIEAILANDQALRQQLIEHRDALGHLIQVSRCKQDLNRTYAGGRIINAGNRFRQKTS